MVDLVKWCLFISYYFGRYSGVLNFEIDFKTGQTRVTNRATISAAVFHIFLFILMGLQVKTVPLLLKIWIKTNSLQDTFFITMSFVRITCVFISLANRWSQRRTFMSLFNSIYGLYRSNPNVIRLCRRSIVSKCLCVLVSNTLQFIMLLMLTSKRLTLLLALSHFAISNFTAIINFMVSQYFAALAIIRGRYNLLNMDLRSVMAETQSLRPNRSGVYATKCCYLADKLEELFRTQTQLQALTDCLSKGYQVEIICLIITYYFNLIGNFYLMFGIQKYTFLTSDTPLIILVGAATYLTFFYVDCWLNLFNIFYLIESHEKTVQLLNQRTLFPPGLDHRLEAVFDAFILNIARNPLKLSFFGLFRIDRAATFVVVNSILSHSILLIQYDVEHY